MKVLYDTNLYIDLLRKKEHLPLFTERSHIRFLSPIVMMELMAGALDPKVKRAVNQLIDPYFRAGRIVALTTNLFYEAGECLAKLQKRRKDSLLLSHDVLIALSAQSIGAILFTKNKKDLEKIGLYLSVGVEFVS